MLRKDSSGLVVQRREYYFRGGFRETQNLLQVLLGRVNGRKFASPKEVTEQDDQVPLRLDHTLVRTYLVDDACPKERDKGEIARFRVVKVRRDPKQVHRPPLAVDQARTSEVLDREPQMMQNLVFPFLRIRIPNNLRHFKQ